MTPKPSKSSKYFISKSSKFSKYISLRFLKHPLIILFLLSLIGGVLFFFFTMKDLDSSSESDTYDLVILGGRVIDPETQTDAILNVGLIGKKITEITSNHLAGKQVIHAKGLVVCPGFINLNVHTMDNDTFVLLARDGVTMALELEGGTADVDSFYKKRKGNSYLHYGVSVGHAAIRMKIYKDHGHMIPYGDAATRVATQKEMNHILYMAETELKKGALGLGLTIAYTPGASRLEILSLFRLAKKYQATLFVHLRQSGNKSLKGLMEVIAASAITDASLHVLHLTSVGHRHALGLLNIIHEAKRHSQLDITTDIYPYTRSMTSIQSTFFNETLLNDPHKFQGQQFIHVESGMLLTSENFHHYQRMGGWVVFGGIPQEVIDKTILDSIVMVAGDVILIDGKGHPRNAGTYAKVLRRYVRQKKTISLMDAIAKMTLLPARRLESRWAMMKKKGRLQVDCDADITIFDPEIITDNATYIDPSSPSAGIQYLLINGSLLINKGEFHSNFFPGSSNAGIEKCGFAIMHPIKHSSGYCDIVLGGQWGDEGKAKVIDALCSQYDMVVRYQGGSNAGHTVVANEKQYVFHLIPSGMLHPNMKGILGSGVVISLSHLKEEIKSLISRGISFDGRFHISSQCFLVLEHHQKLDAAQEIMKGLHLIGTTKRGIGPAYVDKVARKGIRLIDLEDPKTLRQKLEYLAIETNFLFENFYKTSYRMDVSKVLDQLLTDYAFLRSYVIDSPYFFKDALTDGKKILLEGAQGTGLDLDFGSYPYVTSSSPTVGGALCGTGINHTYLRHIIGVFKVYATRVGEGMLPTRLEDDPLIALRKHGNEFGATTGRPRECGWFDSVQARHSVMINGVTHVVLTKLDVFDTYETIKVCTHYNIDGVAVHTFPAALQSFQNAKPVYHVFEGWQQNTSNIHTFDDLPEPAKQFIFFLENKIECPIKYVSNGADRKHLIVRKD